MTLKELTASRINGIVIDAEDDTIQVSCMVRVDHADAEFTETIPADLCPNYLSDAVRELVEQARRAIAERAIDEHIHCDKCVGSCCTSAANEDGGEWRVDITQADLDRIGEIDPMFARNVEMLDEPTWWGAVGFVRMRPGVGNPLLPKAKRSVDVCPYLTFVGNQARCKIYDIRPEACRNFAMSECQKFYPIRIKA